jgi:hypothetical protein
MLLRGTKVAGGESDGGDVAVLDIARQGSHLEIGVLMLALWLGKPVGGLLRTLGEWGSPIRDACTNVLWSSWSGSCWVCN